MDKNIIKKYVSTIKELIKTPEYQKLKKENYMEFLDNLHKICPTFFNNYPSILRMIIDEEDLSILDLYLEKIDNIKSGKEKLDNVKNELGHFLHNKYVKEDIEKID